MFSYVYSFQTDLDCKVATVSHLIRIKMMPISINDFPLKLRGSNTPNQQRFKNTATFFGIGTSNIMIFYFSEVPILFPKGKN